MDFKNDLIETVKASFAEEGIACPDGDATHFARRYFEMRIRRIAPGQRRVRFSNEIHASLGRLVQELDANLAEDARKAWRAAFKLCWLFETGADVKPYLSTRIKYANRNDKLLWDYGMHHFHLGEQFDQSGFVERSDYLLYAMVNDEDALFVDVRLHSDPEDLQWVRQDLLIIVSTNWPEVIDAHVLHGLTGDTITDREKKELRRKNANYAPKLAEAAVMPLGGGMTSDGSSLRCLWWALKLLHEIGNHETYLSSQPVELREALASNGVRVFGDMEFQLVLLENLNPTTELVAALQQHNCLSRDLSRMGFAIVEATSRAPIVVSVEPEE